MNERCVFKYCKSVAFSLLVSSVHAIFALLVLFPASVLRKQGFREMSRNERRYGVGYALASKKKQSFVQDKLVELCLQRGIDLICIDISKPLVEQGPFDCILHKLYDERWKRELREYESRHPGVCIIDRPEAIERLHDRSSMLQVVSAVRDFSEQVEDDDDTSFGVPEQIVVVNEEDLKNLEALKFPVIAKPLVATGTTKSHKMSLVYNSEGLGKLTPPLVLQEFVNHGGVIFKVYVVGDYVQCVKRRSLPDVKEDMLKASVGSLTFCQISNLGKYLPSEEHSGGIMDSQDAELPPSALVSKIAMGLRQELKLHLFNFDVIRDTKAGNRYLVIDINYFPGYAKMPAYEFVLTDFFWKIFHDGDSFNKGISLNDTTLKDVVEKDHAEHSKEGLGSNMHSLKDNFTGTKDKSVAGNLTGEEETKDGFIPHALTEEDKAYLQ